MYADQLWESTMDPKTRKLIKVNDGVAALAEKSLSILMGDDTSLRTEWSNENINFVFNDD